MMGSVVLALTLSNAGYVEVQKGPAIETMRSQSSAVTVGVRLHASNFSIQKRQNPTDGDISVCCYPFHLRQFPS